MGMMKLWMSGPMSLLDKLSLKMIQKFSAIQTPLIEQVSVARAVEKLSSRS